MFKRKKSGIAILSKPIILLDDILREAAKNVGCITDIEVFNRFIEEYHALWEKYDKNCCVMALKSKIDCLVEKEQGIAKELQ